MKITILNGNPDANNNVFDGYLKKLSDVLVSHNHLVNILDLREMDIRYCVGWLLVENSGRMCGGRWLI